MQRTPFTYDFTGLTKVISGGQCGADRGGLEAARDCGVQTGGVAPKGWRTERGADPSLAEFGLVEAPSADYAYRTRLNVEHSDGTVLVVSDPESAGSRFTIKRCQTLYKPHLILTLLKNTDYTEGYSNQLAEFIKAYSISVLNVAGNRDVLGSDRHRDVTYRLVSGAIRLLQQ